MSRQIRNRELVFLADAYFDIQDARIKIELRFSSIGKGLVPEEREGIEKSLTVYQEAMKEALKKEEEHTINAIKAIAGTHPIFKFLVTIPGFGEATTAKIMGIYDWPGHYPTISASWRYFGLAVTDGVGDKRSKNNGTFQKFNGRMKGVLLGPKGLVDQIVMRRIYPYFEVMQTYKNRIQQDHPDIICLKCGSVGQSAQDEENKWYCLECGARAEDGELKYTPGHIHKMAKRYIAKRFMADLWAVWRQLEGLPVEGPWISQQPGHHFEEPLLLEAYKHYSTTPE